MQILEGDQNVFLVVTKIILVVCPGFGGRVSPIQKSILFEDIFVDF